MSRARLGVQPPPLQPPPPPFLPPPQKDQKERTQLQNPGPPRQPRNNAKGNIYGAHSTWHDQLESLHETREEVAFLFNDKESKVVAPNQIARFFNSGDCQSLLCKSLLDLDLKNSPIREEAHDDSNAHPMGEWSVVSQMLLI